MAALQDAIRELEELRKELIDILQKIATVDLPGIEAPLNKVRGSQVLLQETIDEVVKLRHEVGGLQSQLEIAAAGVNQIIDKEINRLRNAYSK